MLLISAKIFRLWRLPNGEGADGTDEADEAVNSTDPPRPHGKCHSHPRDRSPPKVIPHPEQAGCWPVVK